jgi:hypothetical protein
MFNTAPPPSSTHPPPTLTHTGAAVPGVTLYISDFKRSLVDKLQKDFFAEPSQVRQQLLAGGIN